MQSLVAAMNHIICNAGSIYSETPPILKSMVCIWNNATGSQPLVKTFCTIYLGCLWAFIFLMKQSFFKKLFIRAFAVIIDDFKIFLFLSVPLRAYIYGIFDLCGFNNGL